MVLGYTHIVRPILLYWLAIWLEPVGLGASQMRHGSCSSKHQLSNPGCFIRLPDVHPFNSFDIKQALSVEVKITIITVKLVVPYEELIEICTCSIHLLYLFCTNYLWLVRLWIHCSITIISSITGSLDLPALIPLPRGPVNRGSTVALASFGISLNAAMSCGY